MDIRWKDGEGNILNADNKSIRYLDAKSSVKTVIKKEDVKKIIIEDGMMHIFKDFEDDLIITIVIPRKMNRAATKIYNAYDKTGKMLKRKTGSFFLDLILESSIILYNPILGIVSIAAIVLFAILGILLLLEQILGDVGLWIARLIIIGYPIYSIASYIYTVIYRKIIARNEQRAANNTY